MTTNQVEHCSKHGNYVLFCGGCYWDKHPNEDGIPFTGLRGGDAI